MKKYTLYIFTIAALAFASACHKTPQPTPVPDPEPGPIYEDMKASEIWYTTTDGKAMTPVNIGDFDVNYVSTVFDKETGTGVMYFDGPIKKIGDNAFAGSEILATVVLPENVQTIGKNAFKGCKNLTSVEFNGSVNEICDYAFSECGFEEFKFPGKITKMGTGVLKGCKALTKVTFNNNVAVIGDYCFDGCEKLTDVTFPADVKTIGDCIFRGCTSLVILYANFKDALPVLGKDVFENGSNLFVRVSYDRFNDYKAAWGDNARHIMVGSGSEKIDLKNWTDYMPDCMPLSMMTIPSAHDAATYFADEHGVYACILKDQNLDYKDQWGYGIRFFDLRIGYDDDDDYYFYHGPYGYWSKLDELSTIKELPDYNTIKNSFMFLEFQVDNPDSDHLDKGKMKDLMKKVMSYLTEDGMYASSNFVAYHPDMTLEEARGKILISITDEPLGAGITLPYVYRSGGQITPFNSSTSTTPFDIVVQNEFEVKDGDAKLSKIKEGLQKHKEAGLSVPFFNGLNATQDHHPMPGQSWAISQVVNPSVANSLESLEDIYMQPLGFTFFDFVGVENIILIFSKEVFMGGTLARDLVMHNFKDGIY